MSAQPTPHPDKKIWLIAGPAIISNVSTALVGLIDTWAIGRINDAGALAGLAIAAFALSFIFWSLGFLRMGATGLTAQAFGARQSGRLIRVTARSLILGLGIGLILLAAKVWLAEAALALLDATGEVAGHALVYMRIRLWALPFVLAKLAVVGFLIGTQRARVAMGLEICLNLLNAALTVWFVAGLGWGIAGAAAASLIAEGLAGLSAMTIAVLILKPRLIRMSLKQQRFWRAGRFAALMAVNGLLFIRTLFLLAAFGLFLRWSNEMGASALAANHILLNFVTLTALGLDGIAYAAEALVGEAVGARAALEVRYWALRTSLWAGGMSVGYAALFWFFGADLVALFTELDGIRRMAAEGLPWLSLLPLIAVWSYQLDGIFIGATRSAAMMWSMIAAFLAYYALAPVLMAANQYIGLWQAFLVFLTLRAGGLALAYPALERSVLAKSSPPRPKTR